MLLAKTLALSQTRFLSREQQAFQGPAWEASAMLRADHPWRLIPPGTPAAQVAAELSLRARTLRERYPGARMQAPHQKDAHIERWPRPRRMDDGALAYANETEAELTSKLKLAS